jgi:hypothetical protein
MKKKKKSAAELQSARFIAAAKAFGVDVTGKKFEKAMKKIVKVPKSKIPPR